MAIGWDLINAFGGVYDESPMASAVTKAVIPVAGFATRFLPQTKAMPKQMLPLVDKPVIQYIVEQLVNAGIKDIIIVTNYYERSIEDHFDRPHGDLIENLLLGGEKKKPYIDMVNRVAEMANFVYVRQKGPYGNGTPLLNVKDLIDNEPFIYTWGDEFIEVKDQSMFTQLVDTYNKYDCSVMASIRCRNDEDYKRFGIVGGEEIEPGLIDIKNVIEKPGKDKAPSDLANVTGFLFTPDVFDYIVKAKDILKEGEELWYNDALKLMLADGKRAMAKEIIGGVYRDAGTPLEYMKTSVKMALDHETIGEEFRKFLEELKVTA